MLKVDSKGRRLWNEEDTGKIIALWNEGYAQTDIAIKLESTQKAIDHKIRQLRDLNKIGYRESKETQDKLLRVDSTQTKIVLNYLEKKVLPISQSVNIYPKKSKHGKIEEEAILVLSDIHMGKKTPSFDLKIISKQFYILHDSISSIMRILRQGYIINKLNIILAGDMVDNDSIYPSQAHYVEFPVIDQIFIGYPLLRQFILNLLTIFPEIEINCVYGNHGRVNKFASRKTNWDYVLYKLLEMELKRYKEVKINVADDFYTMTDIEGYKFLAVHGDCITSYLNIPYYGLTQALARWAGSMPDDFDYMVSGHWHSSGTIDWNDKTLILNGCFPIDDDFALRVIKTKSANKQWFMGCNFKKGVTWRFDLHI